MNKYVLTVFALCVVILNCSASGDSLETVIIRSPQQLNLLSYNIKMLPRILVKRTVHPGKRAKIICEKIIADTLDVIVFQEAFDPTIRTEIKRRLRKDFPYHTKPGNMKAGFKFCSGVWMFSKFPIKAVDEVCFRTCDGADCMVHKGGQLCEVTLPDTSKVQVMGTHCEAGGSFEMKVSQFYQLKELMDKHYSDDIPQIACGDFNCSISNRPLYDTLLKILNMTDGPLSGELQYTSDHALNDMDTYNPDRRNLIDHFFYRAKNKIPVIQERRVVRYQKKYTKKNSDLSDHFAVKMNLTL